MAESTCLHIQDHDAGPIRIVEIPWISARIGRAAFCEVRLTDPSLPEEACRIHRRGRTWHLTPLHGSDVTLNGHPVEGPRSLPYDSSFQVGPFRLALRRGKFAEPDWRPTADAHRPRSPRVEPTPTAAEPAPPLTNAWEARWRDAGGRLKAARDAAPRVEPAPPPPMPAPPPAPAAERPAPREIPRPAAAPRVEPAPPPRPATRPVAPKYEPRAYSRPTPPPPRQRPAPAQKPPAPQAWTKPVPSPAPPVPKAAPPAPTPAPPMPKAASPVAEAPTPVAEAQTPVAEAQTPVRRFHFLDADLIARLEAPDVVEAFQAVPAPRAFRRRLRRATVERGASDVDVLPPPPEDRPAPAASTALALIQAPAAASTPAPGVDAAAVPINAVPTFEFPEDAAIESDRVVLDAMTAAPIASLEQACPAPDSIDLPPSNLLSGEVDHEVEAMSTAPAIEAALLEEVRRPSPDPSGHPLPTGEGTSDVTAPLPEGQSLSAEEDGPVIEATFEPEAPSAWAYSTGPFVADTNGFGFGPVPAPVDFEPSRPRRAVARAVEEVAEGFDPTRTRRSSGEEAWVLPSVQDVLNNGLRRANAEAGKIPRPPARPSPATPTVAIEPAQWSPPAWLATPPALAATLAVGGLLAFCSWRQAKVSHDAAAVIQASASVRLAGAAAKDRPLPPGIVPPSPSWWGAAPAHLAEWGVYLDGTKVEHGWGATAAGMFEAAAAVGPLDPLSKFALARKRGEATPAPGLSRDAVALAWTGRTLHRAGRDAEAVRAYRRALEVAAKAEPPRGAPLAYSEDPNVPRYLLPGEDLAAAVVRELAADASWSYRDWAEAVPETGVSALAAARALRKDGRPEADAILRRIVERAEADAKALAGGGGPDVAPENEDEAVTLAVAAEAMAMRSDWKGSAGRYRAAIDRMADPRVRRSWWFNLADVAMHSNDVDQRRAALDEALASADSDEVSRRVLELRHTTSALRPKAN